jgi:hypothetical protein
MKEEFNTLIEKAIQLELLVAEFYIRLHELFPLDAGFWWTLAIEEKNHAALLKTLREMQDSHLEIPADFYPEGSEVLEESMRKISEAMREIEKKPDRNLALRMAYDIENSAGEIHYDSFAKTESKSPVAGVFRTLNGSDIDHARRIREYMDRLGMA